MKTFVPAVALIVVAITATFAQQRAGAEKNKPIIVAFYDEERLRGSAGETALNNFQYFLDAIRQIAKRDFANAEFKVATAGDLVLLPDGTGLNVQNMQPALGYVFSERGRKRVVLSGVQSDRDFACAAAAFFRRSSAACSK